MRAHGVPGFADPGIGANGTPTFDKQALNAVRKDVASRAFAACRAVLARAGVQAGSHSEERQIVARLLPRVLAFSRCMRAHGVTNFPDPNPTNAVIILPRGISKHSPLLIAADRACQTKLR